MNEETTNTTEPAGLFTPAPATAYEKAIADYLTANASDALREKIADAQKANKGIKECYAYITEQARKEANGGNSVMIADDVVYGWAVHYFEDEWRDEIERERKRKEEEEERAAKRKAELEKRKALAAKTEAERIAAMSDEERAAYERAEAERKEAEAKRKAEAEAQDAERRKKEFERKIREAAKAEAAKRKAEVEKAQLTFNF